MAKNGNLHTVPDGNGGWTNKPEGGYPTGSFATQGDAIDAGRNYARLIGGEHFIHRPNGQIRDRNSYGNDPYPPRG